MKKFQDLLRQALFLILSGNEDLYSKKKFQHLLKKDQTRNDDLSRQAPFLILSGNEDLYSKKKFQHLLKKDQTRNDDLSRQALFLILSGNEDLYSKVEKIYDFAERVINPDCFQQVDLSSGSRAMVILAFSLFNGYPADLFDVLSGLDRNNFRLALQAIKLRFEGRPFTIKGQLELAREQILQPNDHGRESLKEL